MVNKSNSKYNEKQKRNQTGNFTKKITANREDNDDNAPKRDRRRTEVRILTEIVLKLEQIGANRNRTVQDRSEKEVTSN